MKKLVAMISVLVLAAPTAIAGSPDNPGVHGGIVADAAQVLKDSGSSLGQAIQEVREGFPDYKLGEEVQELKDLEGGSPNPDNDNGGGND